MNYKIIINEDELINFIDFLPPLGDNETYNVILMVRSKYANDIGYNVDFPLKSFTSSKKHLINSIRQLEVPIGAYQFNSTIVPQEALALYITPNPRDLKLASRRLAKELIDLPFEDNPVFNPNKLLKTMIQTSSAKKIFIHFDFDDVTFNEVKDFILQHVNKEAITIINTRGGFHLLIKIDDIEVKYRKGFYQNLTNHPNVDVRDGAQKNDKKKNRGGMLLPIPGCVQGSKDSSIFSPTFTTKIK